MFQAGELVADASTEIPFVVKLSPKQPGEKLSDESLPTDCKVMSALMTKTFMTPDGIKGITRSLELDYIKIGGKQTVKVQHSHQKQCTVPITRWERSVSDATEAFAVARFSFDFEVDCGKPPCP